MKRIIIHYPFIAKYRIPIFKLLSNSKKFNFKFLAGSENNDPYLLTETNDLDYEDIGFSTINIPFKKNNIEWQPKAIKKVLFEKIDCYIILGNPNSLSNWIISFLLRIRKIPLLMWSHGYLKDEKGIKGIIRKKFYKLANGHLLYGNRAKEIMINKGFHENTLHVIYNSLDYEKQSFYRNRLSYIDRELTKNNLGLPIDSIVLLSIGRLMTKLKINYVIDAVSKSKNIALIIVGDGPEKDNLLKQTENLDIQEKIIFYGSCHNEEILSKLYNASDYSVVMGKVGLSAMHSLAYGVPMITNNNLDKHFPEIEAIVENKTGFYFEEDNIDDFLAKILPINYRGEYFTNCITTIEEIYTPEIQQKLIEEAMFSYIKDDNFETNT